MVLDPLMEFWEVRRGVTVHESTLLLMLYTGLIFVHIRSVRLEKVARPTGTSCVAY